MFRLVLPITLLSAGSLVVALTVGSVHQTDACAGVGQSQNPRAPSWLAPRAPSPLPDPYAAQANPRVELTKAPERAADG